MPGGENEGGSHAICPWSQDQDSEEALAVSGGQGRGIIGQAPFLLALNKTYYPQHLLKCSFDVVKRWVNEAQEAASSDNIMVQVRCEPE